MVNVTATLRLKGKGRKQCYQSPVHPGAGAQSRGIGKEHLTFSLLQSSGQRFLLHALKQKLEGPGDALRRG